MLVIKVELHSGITGEITEIARAEIINLAHTKNDYKCYFHAPHPFEGQYYTCLETVVEDHPREYSVWKLIYTALKQCITGAKPGGKK